MRINPINFNNTTFKGIISPQGKQVSQKIFDKNESIYEDLSDAKGLDIWALSTTDGAAYSGRNKKFTIFIQEKLSGKTIKTLECVDREKQDCEDLKGLNDDVLQSLIWAKADCNMSASAIFADSNTAKKQPNAAKKIIQALMYAGQQGSSAYPDKFESIGKK